MYTNTQEKKKREREGGEQLGDHYNNPGRREQWQKREA
jgi:hypothetical protein